MACRRSALAGFAAALLVASPVAFAECDGAGVLFKANFADPAALESWHHDADVSIGGGKMAMALAPAKTWEFAEQQAEALWNTDPKPTEICGDFHFGADIGDGIQTGILFWSVVDRRNTWDGYVWVVSTAGYVTLLRLDNGKFQIVFDAPNPSARGGANATNSLRVSWDQNGTSFFVNGALALKKPDIFIPVGSTKFGVVSILMQPAGKPASVQVENFRVTAPSGR